MVETRALGSWGSYQTRELVHAAYSDQHGIEMVHAAWWERELEELDRQERREGRLSTWYGWYD